MKKNAYIVIACALASTFTAGAQVICSDSMSVEDVVAENMTAEQMNRLGRDYAYGRNGKAQDYTKAFHWFEQAAKCGNVDATYNLGFMYQYGYGVTGNSSKAMKLYKSAARRGSAIAQCRVAYMYQRGICVNRNYYR